MEFNTFVTKILLRYVPLLTFFVDSWDHDDNVDIKVDDAIDSVRNHQPLLKGKIVQRAPGKGGTLNPCLTLNNCDKILKY